MLRTSKQAQTRNTRGLRPMFAPEHCNLCPRCRRYFCPRALQLAPHALPQTQYGQEPWPCLCQRSNMGSWPHLCQKIAETAWLRRHSHITAPLSNAAYCVCVRAGPVRQEVLRLHLWGVDRPALASDKTVKDLLHGCRQFCSLENEFLLEGLCRFDLLAPHPHVWQVCT